MSTVLSPEHSQNMPMKSVTCEVSRLRRSMEVISSWPWNMRSQV